MRRIAAIVEGHGEVEAVPILLRRIAESLSPGAWARRAIDCYRRIREVVNDAFERIVPGHDPLLFERHRSWTAGINPTAEIHIADGDYSRADSAGC